MNDVVFYEQPSKYIVESTEYDDKYTTPVLTPGKSFILGYTKETKGVFTNIPTIIFDDFTTESKYVDFVFKVKSSAMKILNCSNLINIKFIYYLLQVINIDTTTHKRHWLSNYEYMIIPIPSKKIQDKIVNRIESLFDRVNEIDNHYNRIARLKSVLKSKIIDLAIKGELTKQLSTDEPSSKLIENIIEEKHKLMAEGKIRKENLSIIYKDTDNQFYEKFDDGKIVNITNKIPFSIPNNWSWTRLKNIFKFINGDRGKNYPSKEKLLLDGKIPFISAINMEKNLVKKEGLLFVSDEQYNKLRTGKLQKNDFVFCLRGSLGKHCKYNYDTGAIASSLVILRKIGEILDDYISLYLDSPLIIQEINSTNNGTAQPNLGARDVMEYLIPIPPLNEQFRIISKINQIRNIL